MIDECRMRPSRSLAVKRLVGAGIRFRAYSLNAIRRRHAFAASSVTAQVSPRSRRQRRATRARVRGTRSRAAVLHAVGAAYLVDCNQMDYGDGASAPKSTSLLRRNDTAEPCVRERGTSMCTVR
jgi:hypothetical protein